MGLNNIDKHQHLQGINGPCKLHDYLANLKCWSTTLTALIIFLFFKKMMGNVINTL